MVLPTVHIFGQYIIYAIITDCYEFCQHSCPQVKTTLDIRPSLVISSTSSFSPYALMNPDSEPKMNRLLCFMLVAAINCGCVDDESRVDTKLTVIREFQPYALLWQGWKKNNLTPGQFKTKIAKQFVPAAPAANAANGMRSFLTGLPPIKRSRSIPDAISLITFESQKVYEQTLTNDAGRQFDAMHWDLFDKKRGSHFEAAIDFNAKKPSRLESGRAYDMIGKPIHWQKGHNVFFIGLRKNTVNVDAFFDRMFKHVQMAGDAFGNIGLKGYVFLLTETYEIAFMNWESQKAMEAAFKTKAAAAIVKDASELMGTLMWTVAAEFTGNINDGEVKNVRFATRVGQ